MRLTAALTAELEEAARNAIAAQTNASVLVLSGMGDGATWPAGTYANTSGATPLEVAAAVNAALGVGNQMFEQVLQNLGAVVGVTAENVTALASSYTDAVIWWQLIPGILTGVPIFSVSSIQGMINAGKIDIAALNLSGLDSAVTIGDDPAGPLPTVAVTAVINPDGTPVAAPASPTAAVDTSVPSAATSPAVAQYGKGNPPLDANGNPLFEIDANGCVAGVDAGTVCSDLLKPVATTQARSAWWLGLPGAVIEGANRPGVYLAGDETRWVTEAQVSALVTDEYVNANESKDFYALLKSMNPATKSFAESALVEAKAAAIALVTAGTATEGEKWLAQQDIPALIVAAANDPATQLKISTVMADLQWYSPVSVTATAPAETPAVAWSTSTPEGAISKAQLAFERYFGPWINQGYDKPLTEAEMRLRVEEISWSPMSLWRTYQPQFAEILGLSRGSSSRPGRMLTMDYSFDGAGALTRNEQRDLWEEYVQPIIDKANAVEVHAAGIEMLGAAWPTESDFQRARNGMEEAVQELMRRKYETEHMDYGPESRGETLEPGLKPEP